MSNSISVRDATPADAAVIVENNVRLASETEDTTLAVDQVRRGVERLLEDETLGRYYVACAGDEIVGQVMLTYEWSDWRNGPIWWLQSVYVRADFREQGVFRALYRHVESSATLSGAVGLRLYVEHNNTRAQEVYRRLGMREAGYHVLEKMAADSGQEAG